ncbi:MAG: nucleotidyltransferase domain-containing protein [Nitrospiria bacterium]
MKYLVSETVTESVLKAIKKYIPEGHYRLFYFGSRVNGTASSRSDIDIGIESDQDIPLEVMSKIKDELEEIPILQKIDFVDFKRTSNKFSEEAKSCVELIYEQ